MKMHFTAEKQRAGRLDFDGADIAYFCREVTENNLKRSNATIN